MNLIDKKLTVAEMSALITSTPRGSYLPITHRALRAFFGEG
jgi:hypothetical protein